MNDSFPIGRIFGIELRVHILFVYLAAVLILLGAAGGSGLTTAAFLALLVVLVVLHELGHARVAQHFGVTVVDIVLWPLGGMARMTALPEDPKVEGWVAIAGPAVNFALAAIGSLGLLVTHSLPWVHPIYGDLNGLQGLLALFVWVNLMLGGFNLVPAFPMDGGRLLRALLARRRDWLEATEVAVGVSRIVAFVMILGSFLLRPFNCTLPLIGVYLLFEGTRELWATRLRHVGADAFSFGEAGGPEEWAGGGRTIDLSELLRRAARGGAPPPPGPAPPSSPPPPSSGGFSEEEIRRLERFHGRLPRPPRERDT